MTNLRNSDLRSRDIRKLIECKSQALVWERNESESSEWVFASVESEKHKSKLVNWLRSKNIEPSCACIVVVSSRATPKRILWSTVVEKPEMFFGKSEFQLCDLDLNWVLEYKIQEIARFGKFVAKANA